MNRRILITIFCLVLMGRFGANCLAQLNDGRNSKKVTVTLVRWPYT